MKLSKFDFNISAIELLRVYAHKHGSWLNLVLRVGVTRRSTLLVLLLCATPLRRSLSFADETQRLICARCQRAAMAEGGWFASSQSRAAHVLACASLAP